MGCAHALAWLSPRRTAARGAQDGHTERAFTSCRRPGQAPAARRGDAL